MYKIFKFTRTNKFILNRIYNISRIFFSRRDDKILKSIKSSQLNKISNKSPLDELKNKPFENDQSLFFTNNLYLKIISCLNKLGELHNLNEENKFTKFKELLDDQNVKIDDEEILTLIQLSNSKKYVNKEIDGEELDKDEKFSEIMDYVEKIVNEELSEEEFTDKNKNKIRFKRPPHTLNELKSVLTEAEEIYEKHRNILLENDQKAIHEMNEKFITKIPNYMILRNLSFPATDSEVILVGVQKNSNLHSLFLSNLLESTKPDMISVHLPPDIPLFINAEGNFKNDWRSFVAASENFHFLINPLPSSINDVLISVKKIEKMFDENFAYSKEISISPKIIFSQQKPLAFKDIENNYADAHLTSFIYSFNTRHDNYCPIIVSDYPILRFIDDIVHTIKIDDLKKIFKKYIDEMSKENFSFSLEQFYPEIFLTHRMNYTAEVLRQACYSSKKIVMVVNHEFVDALINSWKDLDPKLKSLYEFYKENDDDIIFVDYMEKMVIIDLLTGSFINNNFIKYNKFPFTIKSSPTWVNGLPSFFMVWKNYHDHYSGLLGQIPFKIENFEKHLKKFNVGAIEEVDKAKEKEDLLQELREETNY